MATQARAAGADLWFVTDRDSPKIADLRRDKNINLSYYNNRTREWISVSGAARIVTDRKKIRELYRPDWAMWFGDNGGPKAGTPEDPRIVLIGVNIKIAAYLEVNKPQAVVLFEYLKGLLTRTPPKLPESKEITRPKKRSRR